jgi:hypothetical protein
MKKTLIFAWFALFVTGMAGAAVRDETTVSRGTRSSAATVSARAAAEPRTSGRAAAPRAAAVSAAKAPDVSSRDRRSAVSRAAATTAAAARTAATTARTAAVSAAARGAGAPTVSRAAASPRATAPAKTSTTARAAAPVAESKTFGTGYNACRDSYFTCMDQFCAKVDDTYRRCVCSSKLEDIKAKERALGQTAQQLQDFKDTNIDVISKTGAEVKSMLTASEGENAAAKAKDKSNSAKQLAGISAVLSKTKSESLSTQGKLDIAGDINAIWSTTDLAAGADLSNLTGEKLYNAVNAQCSVYAREVCESSATVNMVVSAYGMYIENDCSNLSNALSKKKTAAQGAIRETEREMNLARLENYNAHNSTPINDCIAQVRKDITSEAACGADYVHCLDISGKYLKRDTGEPIYTSDFYQLELQISLSGDVLSNQTNRLLVTELNHKKESAARGLDTCRDLAGEVWDEFMRQAIAEIYQGQQERVRKVKNECIDVVNACYDTQSKSLKDFSNVKEQLLLGARLELSEQMCQEKLDACSNLYGGGNTGLDELVDTMRGITDQKIAKDCKTALMEYAQDICMVPSNDTLHGYPFGCRVYKPGEGRFATIPECNQIFTETETPDNSTGSIKIPTPSGGGYNCSASKRYTSCKEGYYLYHDKSAHSLKYDDASGGTVGNACAQCPQDYVCTGGTSEPIFTSADGCMDGGEYIGSLYQKMVRYAIQTCIRPSEVDEVISTVVLEDVNTVMDSIKVAMGRVLSADCERLGGTWVDIPVTDAQKIIDRSECEYVKFYTETSSNYRWGYCKSKTAYPSSGGQCTNN